MLAPIVKSFMSCSDSLNFHYAAWILKLHVPPVGSNASHVIVPLDMLCSILKSVRVHGHHDVDAGGVQ